MKIELTEEQARVLRSMNRYWEEVARRETDTREIWQNEERQLWSVLNTSQVLLIVGEYAKSFAKEI